jgi:TonB-linked SusC/RagA family outer membrane protein
MKFTITKNRQKPKWLLLMLIVLFIQVRANAQQSITVTGKVTDETGETLPGVNIKVKGTSVATAANVNGMFIIKVPDTRGTLVFTYVGYKTVEMPINGQVQINITMTADAKSLNDVVVIGYGTQKREFVTGAITTVKAEDFNTGNITDPMTLLQGKVAGLAVSKSGGSDPNGMDDFQLRGPASVFGYSQPLLVIDGVVGGDLQMIAPNDIASIDVLKDASAGAIYGSKANGGVIIVTTKKGKAGVTTITYDGNISTDLIEKNYDMLNAQEYLALGKKYGLAVKNEGANTNWFDAVTRTPLSNSHNLSLSGGTDKTTYYAAVDYKNLQGIDLVDTRQFIEGTARVSTKAMNDKLNFTVSLTNSFDNKYYANTSALAQTLNMNPTFPIKNPDDTYYENPGAYSLQWNPVENELENTNNDVEKRLMGSADLSYNIISTLKADVSFSTIREDYTGGSYTDNTDYFQSNSSLASANLNGQASRSEDNTIDNVFNAILTYSKQIKKHGFDFTAGYSYEYNFIDQFGMGNNNFNTNAYSFYNLGGGGALNDLTPGDNRSGVYESGDASERDLASYFARVLYNYDEKYLLNLTIRRDGASVLGADNKYGTFYGVSGGWIITKENFLQDNTFIKYLKLRAGYGSTGNQQAISPYESLALLGPLTAVDGETGATLPQNGYVGTPGTGTWIVPFGPTNNQNTQLQWETSHETDLGLDFSLFDNSWLTGTLDFYNKRISNLLGDFSAQVPANIFPTITANTGLFVDKGVELALNAKLVSTKQFNWNVSFTSAYNEDNVVSLSGEQFHGSAQYISNLDGNFIQRIAPGEPVSEFYGPEFAGFTTKGKWLFYNAAGKKVGESQLNPNTDYKNLGTGIPKYNLSLTNNFRYGNFDASIMLRAALGFKAVNAKRLYHENLSEYSTSNLFSSVASTPDPVQADEKFSSYYIENGNYLKVDNLSIGYNVPLSKTGSIKTLRISLTAQNLLTITSFSGTDPELPLSVNFNNDVNTFPNEPGLESNYNYYPSTRTFTLGVNASF